MEVASRSEPQGPVRRRREERSARRTPAGWRDAGETAERASWPQSSGNGKVALPLINYGHLNKT